MMHIMNIPYTPIIKSDISYFLVQEEFLGGISASKVDDFKSASK